LIPPTPPPPSFQSSLYLYYTLPEGFHCDRLIVISSDLSIDNNTACSDDGKVCIMFSMRYALILFTFTYDSILYITRVRFHQTSVNENVHRRCGTCSMQYNNIIRCRRRRTLLFSPAAHQYSLSAAHSCAYCYYIVSRDAVSCP